VKIRARARHRKDYAAEQPKDGDCVLVCIHIEQDFLDSTPIFHWYKSETDFKRPDGTTGHAEWIVVCPACFEKYSDIDGCLIDEDNFHPPIAGDRIWSGNAPAIRKP
jgi:hypothetical protein